MMQNRRSQWGDRNWGGVILWVFMGTMGIVGTMGILYLPSIPNIPSIPTIRHNATETTIETNLFILKHFYWKNKCFR